MAATSLAGRARVGRDAILSAPRQASDQTDGLFRPGHLDRQGARCVVAHPVLAVADASADRVVARSGAGRCPAPSQELARGCRRASGGKELAYVLVRQELRPLDALPLVACRAALDVLPAALHWGLDALQPVVPQERQAGAGARALALEPQQVREQQQVPRASLPLDLAPLWVLPVPLAAQRARRGPVQHLAPVELLSARPEPPPDEQRAHVPQVHVLPVSQKLVLRVSPEPRLLHAARDAFAPP